MPRETVRLLIVNKNVWQAENTLPLFPLTTGLATERVASLKERKKNPKAIGSFKKEQVKKFFKFMVLMWGKYVHQKESKHFNAEHTANTFSALITKHDAPDQKIRCRKNIYPHERQDL